MSRSFLCVLFFSLVLKPCMIRIWSPVRTSALPWHGGFPYQVMFNEKPYPLDVRSLYSTRGDWLFNELHLLKGRSSLYPTTPRNESGHLCYTKNRSNHVPWVKGSEIALKESEAQTKHDTDLAQISPNRYQSPNESLEVRSLTHDEQMELLLRSYFSRNGVTLYDSLAVILAPSGSQKDKSQMSYTSMAPFLSLEHHYDPSRYTESPNISHAPPGVLMELAKEIAWLIMDLPENDVITDEEDQILYELTDVLLQPYLDTDTITRLSRQAKVFDNAIATGWIPEPNDYPSGSLESYKCMALSLNLEDLYNVRKNQKSEKFCDLPTMSLMLFAKEVAWSALALPVEDEITDEELREVNKLIAILLKPYPDADTIAKWVLLEKTPDNTITTDIPTDQNNCRPCNSVRTTREHPIAEDLHHDTTRVPLLSTKKHEEFLRVYARFAPLVNRAILEARVLLSLNDDDILTDEQAFELEEELCLILKPYLDMDTLPPSSIVVTPSTTPTTLQNGLDTPKAMHTFALVESMYSNKQEHPLALVESMYSKSDLPPSIRVAILNPDWLLRPPPEPPPAHVLSEHDFDLLKMCQFSTSKTKPLTAHRSPEDKINTNAALLDAPWG